MVTDVLRKHIYTEHPNEWITGCARLNIQIIANEAQPAIQEYKRRQGHLSSNAEAAAQIKGRRLFSHEAFVDAIVEFIVGDDQSLRVIECPQLRAIFLMLRSELKDSDVPHRSTIHNRIMQLLDEHLDRTAAEIAAALGKLSTTMDVWTDQRLRPYMAIRGHWIETKAVPTPSGTQYALKLRSALIGFIQIPGRHDGEHLAHAFLHGIDRIKAANKLGWVTGDNASNMDTFSVQVGTQLRRRAIKFPAREHRIRCFPHITHLACNAVLKAITNMDFADPEAVDFDAHDDTASSFLDAIDRDPIATIRTIIRLIRSSSLRRQFLSEIIATLGLKNLELLPLSFDRQGPPTLKLPSPAIYLEGLILVKEYEDQTGTQAPYFVHTEKEIRKRKLSATTGNVTSVVKRTRSQLPSHVFTPLRSEIGDLPGFSKVLFLFATVSVARDGAVNIIWPDSTATPVACTLQDTPLGQGKTKKVFKAIYDGMPWVAKRFFPGKNKSKFTKTRSSSFKIDLQKFFFRPRPTPLPHLMSSILIVGTPCKQWSHECVDRCDGLGLSKEGFTKALKEPGESDEEEEDQ
ncbi:hypothetical protein R3P38DRAFT_3227535 [Favolaschia claudopus]|uniref:Transposase n=1 Tax=Favolaschia claudopus TaxID=2862362 RepID=A0AAV9ZSG0_9AGAR